MTKIIAIANQKGGVGKTTTAINLSSCLAERGQKVLIIDMDPQGNATCSLSVDKNECENTIYELMIDDEVKIEDCIVRTKFFEVLDLIPSNVNLAGAEIELIGVENNQFILRNEVEKIKDNYDYIIIDCPPSINLLTVNALTTANRVMIPIQCEYLAMEGMVQLLNSIKLVQDRLNSGLIVDGVVFTMFDGRTNLSLDVVESVKNNFDGYKYEAMVPRNIRLSESPSFGEPINVYDPRSKGADAYGRLADEVIGRGE